ncbi:FBXO15 isoform 5, partial [Pongo abelii]
TGSASRRCGGPAGVVARSGGAPGPLGSGDCGACGWGPLAGSPSLRDRALFTVYFIRPAWRNARGRLQREKAYSESVYC